MRKSTVETSLKCGRFRCLYSIALHFISVLRILKGTGLSQRSLSGCDFRKDSKKKKSKKKNRKKKNWSEQVNLLSTWYGPIVGTSSLMIRSGILFTFFFVEFFHRSYLPPPPLQSPWHSYPSRNQTTLPCYLRKAKPRCVFPFTSFSAVAAIIHTALYSKFVICHRLRQNCIIMDPFPSLPEKSLWWIQTDPSAVSEI